MFENTNQFVFRDRLCFSEHVTSSAWLQKKSLLSVTTEQIRDRNEIERQRGRRGHSGWASGDKQLRVSPEPRAGIAKFADLGRQSDSECTTPLPLGDGELLPLSALSQQLSTYPA